MQVKLAEFVFFFIPSLLLDIDPWSTSQSNLSSDYALGKVSNLITHSSTHLLINYMSRWYTRDFVLCSFHH